MTTITVQKPATVLVPRAAPIAAAIAFKILDAIEHAVTSHRSAKAEAGRIVEANAVRRYADEVRALDPRFAADLYAAADRHERG
jgi:hypothetical protein